LPPELRIVSYIFFVSSLFLLPVLKYYLALCLILALLLLRVPYKRLKSGWVPISMFLVFTFLSNAVNHPGRIIFAAGPLLVSSEGLNLAAVRTLRVMLMVGGVKFLMATTRTDDIIQAMSRLLKPFEKAGVPVKDFFHTMGLTMKCFPILQDTIAKYYHEHIRSGTRKSMWEKSKLIALFLLPLFIQSINSPEQFFRDTGQHEEEV
jgi:energy-coupling factor transport system permease protein